MSGILHVDFIQGKVNMRKGVRRAAIAASHRMTALERDAEAIHAKTLLNCTARVLSTKERGIHALLTDANGVTVEISGGELAVAVSKD
jgi:hypothetical protein